MSREWQTGDVAMVRYFDGKWRQAVAETPPPSCGLLAWRFADGRHRDASRAEVRPLVVLDPEDREQVGGLVERFFMEHTPDEHVYDAMQAALRALANPEPDPEPTDPAVRVLDDEDYQWARVGDHWCTLEWYARPWDALLDRGPLTIITPDAPAEPEPRPLQVGDRVRVADNATNARGTGPSSLRGEVVTIFHWGSESCEVDFNDGKWSAPTRFLTLIEPAE